MKDSRRQRRVWYAVGGVLITAFLAYGATSFRSNLTPYVSFADAIGSGNEVQVAGALVQGSTAWQEADSQLQFTLVDDTGLELPVVYDGTKPGNFEEATQIVAVGAYREGVFHAQQLLVKCPSKYQGVEESRSYS